MADISLSKPLYVMLKPVGAHCNLACHYCYYLEKQHLYDDLPRHTMSEATLERFIEQYIAAQTQHEVLFTWHGGETFLRPLAFYRRALELERKHAGGHAIDNCIQTNGTLITEEWARFLRDNHWLVGLSIDGPQEFHDEYRRTRQGRPTWAKVMHGIDLLNRYGVEWNAMAVVNDYNADYPHDFYQFFKQIGCHYIQFAPIVERTTDNGQQSTPSGDVCLTPESVSPQQWGSFLCALFDEWVVSDVGDYYIQIFDATLANWMGVTPGVCSLAETCGHAAAMEFNGDVYACDHFVLPEHRLGNIHSDTLTRMMYSPRQLAFGRAKRDALPRQCRECEWLFACHGECPKNRLLTTVDGEPNLNYLCEGYRQFFRHVAPYMDYMKQELMAQRPPANIMQPEVLQRIKQRQ